MTAANMYRYRRNCPVTGVNVTVTGSRMGFGIMSGTRSISVLVLSIILYE